MVKPVIGLRIDIVIHYHIVEQRVTHFLSLLRKTGILYFGRYVHKETTHTAFNSSLYNHNV